MLRVWCAALLWLPQDLLSESISQTIATTDETVELVYAQMRQVYQNIRLR